MSSRAVAALAGLLLVGAFLAGRASAPESVRVETRTLGVHAKSESEIRAEGVSAEHASHREVLVTELVRPDGTRKTTTRTVTDRQAKNASSSLAESVTSEANVKETLSLKESSAQAGRSLEISLLAGTGISLGSLTYGLHVSRPFLGPLTLGLWGVSNGVAGVSLGIRL